MIENENWCIPKTRSTTQMYGFAIREKLISTHSAYQKIEIVDTYDYKKVILLDDIPQACELDEFIFHEIVVHPAMCAHPNPQRVLIIGGGGGGTLREVIKHANVEEAVMVEIDEELVRIWQEFLPNWDDRALQDPRTTLLFEDGRKYLEENRSLFDCIILDLSDPFEDSPAQKLFTREFYTLVKKSLKPAGIVVLQAESAVYGNNDDHFRLLYTLQQVFGYVQPYYSYIPLFETLYGFALCSDVELPRERLASPKITQILDERGVKNLKFFDSETAVNVFSLPLYLRKKKNDITQKEITDEKPLVAY